MATNMDWINGSADTSILFGSFRLLPRQRLLMEGDKPVRLGSRAFDVLIALLERPGELISKEDLMARVWPNTFVGPANLAVHISALRRALNDGREGNRYVVNIPGRGYRFVEPVTIVEDPLPLAAAAAAGEDRNLMAPLALPIAHAETVEELARQLPQGYSLTVIGPGGIGETRVKLALVPESIDALQNSVWLVNLKPVEKS
jgi:DNA-binding winged helix-turn-helix (wHTH) protein